MIWVTPCGWALALLFTTLLPIGFALAQDNENYKLVFQRSNSPAKAKATAITAWDDYFGHRWLWIRYTETLGMLRSIEADLNYAASKPRTKRL